MLLLTINKDKIIIAEYLTDNDIKIGVNINDFFKEKVPSSPTDKGESK